VSWSRRARSRHRLAAAFNQPHQRVVFDMAGVTSVDTVGEEFLAQVHGHGDTLVGGVTTNAIVDETRARCLTDCRLVEVEGTLRAPVNFELSQRVQALLGRGERRIFLDLSRLLAFFSIRLLLRLHSICELLGKGGRDAGADHFDGPHEFRMR
jgi:hypothetical protein